VAQTLAENGFRNVHALYGGFDAWVKEGYPLEAKAR
jgi:rhodanese-related sulfurtransferase